MFIYNIKFNGTKLFKILLAIIVIVVIVLCGVVAYKIYKASIKINDEIKSEDIVELNNDNYCTILKTVHDDIDTYVGQKIKFSGFIYRVYDLEKNQFVLGRNMLINSDMQTVVVGFLCNYKDSEKLKDGTWVEIEGTITKGKYHGDMPILEIINIKEIQKPEDEYVIPPKEDYIPTSVIL